MDTTRRRLSIGDRLPPHSEEAEKGVIGSVLISAEAMPEAQAKIQTSEVFYDTRLRSVWEAMCEMAAENEPVDSVTLMVRLRAYGELDAVGGPVFVSSLADQVPTSANLGFYITVVLECFQLRKLIQLCTNTIAAAYDGGADAAGILDSFETDALKVRLQESTSVSGNCKASVKAALDMIDGYFQNRGALTGISTGFPDLDRISNGLHNGEMIVIAGRPSMGKSALAMGIADHVAATLKLPVGVFSLEMTEESLILRTICSRSKVNLRNVRSGHLTQRDVPSISLAASALSAAPLYIDDTPGLTITQLRARARRMHQQFGIKLFIIDYLQHMQVVVEKGGSRQGGFADISTGVKMLARELNVPVIILSQISRQYEHDNKKRKPTMADLKETGAIEQDADLIGILYSQEENLAGDAVPVNLLICKQRNGPTGDVRLVFLKSFTRFESASKIDESA